MNGADCKILLGRILVAALFLPGGFEKLLGWPGIVTLIAQHGAPFPMLGGVIAVLCEVVVAGLILLGVAVRPLAVILAIYTVAAALIGHRYWQMSPPADVIARVNFYKNLAIAGGLLALSAAGSGKLALGRILWRWQGGLSGASPSARSDPTPTPSRS